jgi:hypothetical protein
VPSLGAANPPAACASGSWCGTTAHEPDSQVGTPNRGSTQRFNTYHPPKTPTAIQNSVTVRSSAVKGGRVPLFLGDETTFSIYYMLDKQ